MILLDIPTPKNCKECPCFTETGDSYYNLHCLFLEDDRHFGDLEFERYEECKRVGEIPEYHNSLIDINDALEAVDKRIEELSEDETFVRKDNAIDIAGVKKHILDIKPVVKERKL